jgi:hypothetical protein
MDKTIEKQAAAAPQKPVPQRDGGWFGPGDRRINRGGRPRGKVVPEEERIHPADYAKSADRLKRIFFDEAELICGLTQVSGPCLLNIPNFFEIVDCRVDEIRKGIIFVLRSDEFPLVACGSLIPELPTVYDGRLYFKKRFPN